MEKVSPTKLIGEMVAIAFYPISIIVWLLVLWVKFVRRPLPVSIRWIRARLARYRAGAK